MTSTARWIACMAMLPLGLAWLGCGNLSIFSQSNESKLIGDWEAVACQLNIDTEGNTERARIINVSEGEWEKSVNRTPPQMSYYEDHRYTSAYVSLVDPTGRQVRDSVKQNGTWSIHGDTLGIEEPNLSVPKSHFHMKFTEDNRLELTAMMDIDGDGNKDDHYWMLIKHREK